MSRRRRRCATSGRWWLVACSLSGASLWSPPVAAQSRWVEDQEPNRGGTLSYEARDPEVARRHLHPAAGYAVELFASEADFPIGNPVSMTFDGSGRLWVATMPSYPQRLPDQEPDDKIVILEDRDRDGRADHHTVFLDGLHLPTGFELGHGGVYVAQQPNLLFARDLDGDDRAEERQVILHGFGTEDSHHSISVFTWGPGGGLYFQEGTFHHSQVETPYGPVRLVDAGIFRYKPRRHWLEVFVSYRFANPWGHVFDRWGQNFIADASGGANYFGTAITGHAPYPDKRPRMKVFTSVVRPTAGCEIVSSPHFPDEAQGNFLVNNTIGFQGIKRHRMIDEGSGFTSEELEPLLYSTDINFRPVDLQFGPDGALYVVDWFNPLVGHMQYSLRDPRRDSGHGRIWRLTYPQRPLLEPLPIAGRPIPELLDRLGTYEDRARSRIRRELGERDRRQVASGVAALLERLDRRGEQGSELEHHRLEALWVLQTVDVVDEGLLRRMLRSSEPRARAAATRVLRFWRREVEDPLALLERQVNDPFPRTRLEAILALGFFPAPQAAEIALEALEHPGDYYLDYVLGETIDTLEPHWIEPLGDGSLLTRLPPAHASYLLRRLSLAQLADLAPELQEHPLVHAAWLERGAAGAERQRRALAALAAERATDVPSELLRVLEEADRTGGASASSRLRALGQLLLELPPGELQAVADRLERLAFEARHGPLRRTALHAWMRAAGEVEPARRAAASRPDRLVDWLEAVTRLEDRRLQAEAYEAVAALVEPPASGPALPGVRFVRVELPGPGRVLGLGEVEVLAGGENLAPRGSAAQSSTANDASAAAAIDGQRLGAGGVTLTTAEEDPWLEIDLGAPAAVEAVVLFAPEAQRAGRLDRVRGLQVLWLDAERHILYRDAELEWAAGAARVEPARRLRATAVATLSSLPVHREESLDRLLDLVAEGQLRSAAIDGLSTLAARQWPAARRSRLESLASELVDYLGAASVEERTTPRLERAFTLGEGVAARLVDLRAGDDADRLRASLEQLAVTVLALRPVPHQIRFDRRELTVAAGRPVLIRFENTDVMPHNVVITRPGALAEVGVRAERMAIASPAGAEEAGYVPETELVLYATDLLYPGERGQVSFVAPSEPGLYPYLCTFPGHWLIMNGILRVLEPGDRRLLAALEAAAPDPEPAPASRSFVQDWTLDQLRPQAAALDVAARGPAAERSRERGGRLFAEAGCATCHRRAEEGAEVGPDLTGLPSRYTPVETLKHILEPSAAVEEAYRTYLVETDDFRFLTGLLVSEDETEVRLRPNPIEPGSIESVPRSRITSMERSNLSPMPTGLLVTLTREEILDLLRYLHAPTVDSLASVGDGGRQP